MPQITYTESNKNVPKTSAKVVRICAQR